MPKRIKTALIGVGHLGRFHAEKLCQIPLADFVGMIDIEVEKLREIQRYLKHKYGKEIKISNNLKEILKEVDAVIVATPTATHYKISKEVLLHGKALFLEKPIADKLFLAEELVELAEKKNIPFQVGYIERFQRAVQKLLKKIKQPYFIEAHRLNSFVERNLDIDVILDLMIHDLDLVLLLNKGKEIEYIHAVGAPLFTTKPDIVNTRIIFKDGTTCNLTASRISLTRQRKFRVFEKGTYHSVDTFEKSYTEIKPKKRERDFLIYEERFTDDDPLERELKAFFSALIKGKEVSPSGKEALPALKLAFRIKEEVEKNLNLLKSG
ncbi:MAG: Gfo/Idh/MocA family oxidoreductase [Thermodesulfobacteriaceae bacterium]|nr:Gfo/Idh/MocA family oxidoreductase [Thermodesulfobacteriaceae bacterium]